MTVLASISYIFMGVLILSILVLSVLFLVLGGKILSTVHKSLAVESTVMYRVTLLTVSCVMSMLASIGVLVSYFALADVSYVPSFGSSLGLAVMKDVFQLVFLIGMVLAFSIHSLHASSEAGKSTERSTDKGSTPAMNAEDIILDLTERSQAV